MPNRKTIFFLSTFPPRECGLATFTSDLIQSFEKIFSPYITAKVIAMNDGNRNYYVYPPGRVVFQIQQDEKADYIEAADLVNRKKPELICVQHEFGIFGGMYGAYVVDFLRRVKVPRAIVLHTVLPKPQPIFRKRMKELDEASELFIVMTQASKRILMGDYGVKKEKIAVIPHGIPAVPFEFSTMAKKELDLENRMALTTFGLLSRNKGIEYVLRSLPKVIQKYPEAVYLVVGATHPNILKREGEKYRKALFQEVKRLGLTGHVRFYNKYFDLKELIEILKMTDIYIATSTDPFQAVSGTLSYAIGIGRPVISTNFSQAREYVTPPLGKLVPMRDSEAYSQALLSLLADRTRLHTMGYNAYSATRHMTWGNVANAYYRAFIGSAPALETRSRRLPPVKLSHLERMTTSRGILQFSKLVTPSEASGYTLDDNARALYAAAFAHKQGKAKKTARKLAQTYLDFVLQCQVEDGFLLNIFFFDNTPDHRSNSESREEAHARALFALAYVSALSDLPERMQKAAQQKFESLLKEARVDFVFPRAQAIFAKALAFELQKKRLSPELRRKCTKLLRKMCSGLSQAYDAHASPSWEWFESALTYSNGLLPEALFLGAAILGEKKYLAIAERTLRFLLGKTMLHGQAWPIGQNGWLRKGGDRQFFDQQPEEATALVLCLRTAGEVTGNQNYRHEMEAVFGWFLGNNALGQTMYDETTGGCYDGLTPLSVNLNEGSESAICYLMARLSLERSPVELTGAANRWR